MPESHLRHKTKHHHQPGSGHGKKVSTTAGIFMAAMGGIFGLSFGYFTSDRSILWSVIGTVAGILIGYFFGHTIDKSTRKNK
jgi:uncharacterized protein YcfJ